MLYSLSQELSRGMKRDRESVSSTCDDNNALFVQNVGDLSENSLFSHFMKYGQIQRVNIARSVETGESRGFAFVDFETVSEAKSAVAAGNEAEVRPIMLFSTHHFAGN